MRRTGVDHAIQLPEGWQARGAHPHDEFLISDITAAVFLCAGYLAGSSGGAPSRGDGSRIKATCVGGVGTPNRADASAGVVIGVARRSRAAVVFESIVWHCDHVRGRSSRNHSVAVALRWSNCIKLVILQRI